MAYEAATEALAGERAPAALISVSMSAPFGLRKMSATLSRALGLAADTVPYDLGGHPGPMGLGTRLGQVARSSPRLAGGDWLHAATLPVWRMAPMCPRSSWTMSVNSLV